MLGTSCSFEGVYLNKCHQYLAVWYYINYKHFWRFPRFFTAFLVRLCPRKWSCSPTDAPGRRSMKMCAWFWVKSHEFKRLCRLILGVSLSFVGRGCRENLPRLLMGWAGSARLESSTAPGWLIDPTIKHMTVIPWQIVVWVAVFHPENSMVSVVLLSPPSIPANYHSHYEND